LFNINKQGSNAINKFTPSIDRDVILQSNVVGQSILAKAGLKQGISMKDDALNIRLLLTSCWEDPDSLEMLTSLIKKFGKEKSMVKLINSIFSDNPDKIQLILKHSFKNVFESAHKSIKDTLSQIEESSQYYEEKLSSLEKCSNIKRIFKVEGIRSEAEFTFKFEKDDLELDDTVYLDTQTVEAIKDLGCTTEYGQLKPFLGYYVACTQCDEDCERIICL
jgi:hypothetical protein